MSITLSSSPNWDIPSNVADISPSFLAYCSLNHIILLKNSDFKHIFTLKAKKQQIKRYVSLSIREQLIRHQSQVHTHQFNHFSIGMNKPLENNSKSQITHQETRVIVVALTGHQQILSVFELRVKDQQSSKIALLKEVHYPSRSNLKVVSLPQENFIKTFNNKYSHLGNVPCNDFENKEENQDLIFTGNYNGDTHVYQYRYSGVSMRQYHAIGSMYGGEGSEISCIKFSQNSYAIGFANGDLIYRDLNQGLINWTKSRYLRVNDPNNWKVGVEKKSGGITSIDIISMNKDQISFLLACDRSGNAVIVQIQYNQQTQQNMFQLVYHTKIVSHRYKTQKKKNPQIEQNKLHMIHYNIAAINVQNDSLNVIFCNVTGECIVKCLKRKKIFHGQEGGGKVEHYLEQFGEDIIVRVGDEFCSVLSFMKIKNPAFEEVHVITDKQEEQIKQKEQTLMYSEAILLTSDRQIIKIDLQDYTTIKKFRVLEGIPIYHKFSPYNSKEIIFYPKVVNQEQQGLIFWNFQKNTSRFLTTNKLPSSSNILFSKQIEGLIIFSQEFPQQQDFFRISLCYLFQNCKLDQINLKRISTEQSIRLVGWYVKTQNNSKYHTKNSSDQIAQCLSAQQKLRYQLFTAKTQFEPIVVVTSQRVILIDYLNQQLIEYKHCMKGVDFVGLQMQSIKDQSQYWVVTSLQDKIIIYLIDIAKQKYQENIVHQLIFKSEVREFSIKQVANDEEQSLILAVLSQNHIEWMHLSTKFEKLKFWEFKFQDSNSDNEQYITVILQPHPKIIQLLLIKYQLQPDRITIEVWDKGVNILKKNLKYYSKIDSVNWCNTSVPFLYQLKQNSCAEVFQLEQLIQICTSTNIIQQEQKQKSEGGKKKARGKKKAAKKIQKKMAAVEPIPQYSIQNKPILSLIGGIVLFHQSKKKSIQTIKKITKQCQFKQVQQQYPSEASIVLKDIDFYLFRKFSLQTQCNIAKWLIQHQIQEIKYFERYQFLQRYLILKLWLALNQGIKKDELKDLFKVFRNALQQDPKSKEEKFSSVEKNQILAILNMLNLIQSNDIQQNCFHIIDTLCSKSCSIHLQVLINLFRKKITIAINLYCKEKFYVEALVLSKLFQANCTQIYKRIVEGYKDKNQMIFQKARLYETQQMFSSKK